ncbi:MAG TPA: RluA family pseudouridine synthase [Candidatus Binatia bacterium]|nr:RluA family pseudouridine synthase [Candidatus Binatia bacterium]
MVQEISITAGESPKKLENFLKKRFPMGYVRKLFRRNGVRLNGRPGKPDDAVRPGDRVELYIPFDKHLPSRGSVDVEAGVKVIFEDDEIIVINKPAGIAVHEGKAVLKRNSLLGMLEARYRPRGIVPKLVHRLDKDTSGVLVVAKNDAVAKQLEDFFASGKVEKNYLCLLVGRLQQNQGTIDLPLPGRAAQAVRALTHFRVVKRFSETTLVQANIATGRMHQIRLHFAHYGHPVVMDDQHGDFSFNKRLRKQWRLRRQFLHASTLAMPYRGKKHSWTAPLPADLASTLEFLALY